MFCISTKLRKIWVSISRAFSRALLFYNAGYGVGDQKSTFSVNEGTNIFILKCGKEYAPSTYLATFSTMSGSTPTCNFIYAHIGLLCTISTKDVLSTLYAHIIRRIPPTSGNKCGKYGQIFIYARKYDFRWTYVHKIHNRLIHFCGHICTKLHPDR